MFCKKCGKELAEEAIFCPVCGTRKVEIPDGNSFQDAGTDPGRIAADAEEKSGDLKSDKKESGTNIISRVWNSRLFLMIAVKFGNVLEILEGVIGLILSRFLFKEGGFWGIAFGILFALGGIGSCISGVMSLLSRWKNSSEDDTLDEISINKKKRNLCIGVAGIVIVLVVLKNTGGGTYSVVKAISFDNIGSETIGEIVDENIKSPEWSQKKLDNSSKLVYVEGYCPRYGETIKIEFYYEKLKDGSYEVTLNGMYWPDSGEEFDTLETAVAWAALYDYSE